MATLHQSGYARGVRKRACGTMNFVVIPNLLIRPKRKRLCNNTPTTSSHQSPAFTSWGKGRTATQANCAHTLEVGSQLVCLQAHFRVLRNLAKKIRHHHDGVVVAGSQTIMFASRLEQTLSLWNPLLFYLILISPSVLDYRIYQSSGVHIYIYIWIYPTIHHYHHHPYFQCKI